MRKGAAHLSGTAIALRFSFNKIVSVALLATVTASAGAQTGSDIAQELQRQQARERQLREQQEVMPDVRLQVPAGASDDALPVDETPCFPIREVVLKTDVPDFDWVQQAVGSSVALANGRCLGTNGINWLMKRVQDAIIAQGYVTTRVLAEAQDLRAGRLSLSIVPGRIRDIRFTPESDARANAVNVLPASPGDILNLRDIEQALENFKRVPTAEADIQIVPGDAPGESDLLITWRQVFPFRLTLNANDGGTRSTGKNLGSVTVSADHLLTLNDLFYASFNNDIGGSHGKEKGDRGTRGHTVHYSLPWGYWQFAVTTSKNRYHQSVPGVNQTYLYSGTSENHEARISRVVHRDAQGKSTAYLRSYLTQSANFIDDTEVEVQRRRMAGWELGLQHRAFVGQATVDLSAAYRRGTGAFGAIAAPEEAFGDGTHRPRIVSAEASIAAPFKLAGEQLRYLGSWRVQWNRTPLVPQDRFSVGGRYTVRGFDGESVLMAERGWLVRNELGWQLGGSSQELYLGIDHGQVGGPSADLLVGRKLTGAVLGLRGGYGTLSWDVFIGTPLDKPRGFETAHSSSGINLTLSF